MVPWLLALLATIDLPAAGSGARVLYLGEPLTFNGEPITHSFGVSDMDLADALPLYMQSLAEAGASGAAAGVLGFQGSVAKRFAPASLGNVAIYPLNVGQQDLTLAMLKGGVLTADTPSGGTVLNVPTLAALGYTVDSARPTAPCFPYQRRGPGPFAINPKAGVFINWQLAPDGTNSALDPQYLQQGHSIGMLTYGGVNADGLEQWNAT